MSSNSTKKRFRYSTLLLIFGLSIFATGTSFIIFHFQAEKKIQASLQEANNKLGAFPILIPTIEYGFTLDYFDVTKDSIRSGEYLGTILSRQGLSYGEIQKLVDNSKDVFKINNLKINKPYLVLNRDTSTKADYFIYEPSVYAYYVCDLNELEVEKVVKPIDYVQNTICGEIESSLWSAMISQNASPNLFAKMEDALQWSVDFHRVQQGDQFQLVYDQEFINGDQVGVGMVHAAYYKTGKNEHYAIYHHTSDEKAGYYDLEGRPLNKGFLKSPVKSSRISSHFNLRRFHPILKRVRPHLGTDYAAPYGTPIQAVGSGVVVRAGYTKGNGNFVKIKHDDTYQTQYLHMQKFASGIKVGTQVRQGQTIGYVGSTGLATGPHVCFRFWKNGKQVNHLNLNFPPPAPLPKEDLPAFNKARDKYLAILNGACPGEPEEEKVEQESVEPEAKETAENRKKEIPFEG